MANRETYQVLRPFPLRGKDPKAGDTVTLTAKQAKFLKLGGFIALPTKATTKRERSKGE